MRVSVDTVERAPHLPAEEVADMKALARWLDVYPQASSPGVKDDGLVGQETEQPHLELVVAAVVAAVGRSAVADIVDAAAGAAVGVVAVGIAVGGVARS